MTTPRLVVPTKVTFMQKDPTLCKGGKGENAPEFALSWKEPFCSVPIAVQIELLLLCSAQYTEVLFRRKGTS